MKFVKPRVYLVSRPSFDWQEMDKFLGDEGIDLAEKPMISEDIHDSGAPIIEAAARLCYMSYAKGRKDVEDFIRNLMEHRDGSVFEHVNYGVIVTGVSRSLTHELVRHRSGFAYSQRSQRYVDEGDTKFIIPPLLEEISGGALRDFEREMAIVSGRYKIMVEELTNTSNEREYTTLTDKRKAVRSTARSVLPNATETKIFITANVRAWRWFIEQRGSRFADAEIRRLAIMIWHVLREESPLLFNDFELDGQGIEQELVPRYSKI
tara:strand:- start:1648 stop:2439 length:792 start_codon:yes stop_codon:yes gene_type:complete